MHKTSLFQVLIAGGQGAQLAKDLQGRQMTACFSSVCNIDDPNKLRRVKVTTDSKGAITENDYAMRELPCPFWDPPMPQLGQSIAINAFNGNPHDNYYTGVLVNKVNPPFPKADPINDDWRLVPGNKTLQVGKKETIEVKGDRVIQTDGNEHHRINNILIIEAGKTIVIKNDAGASITLLENGSAVLADAWGKKLILAGNSGGGSEAIQWDLNGNSLNIINANDVTIHGKSICTIGAVDSDGDTEIERGW